MYALFIHHILMPRLFHEVLIKLLEDTFSSILSGMTKLNEIIPYKSYIQSFPTKHIIWL